jgi:hypothetical protein
MLQLSYIIVESFLIKTLLVLLSLQGFGFLSIGFGFDYMQLWTIKYLLK